MLKGLFLFTFSFCEIKHANFSCNEYTTDCTFQVPVVFVVFG